MTDIRLVFTTDAQLEDACAKLEQFKAAGRLPEGVSDEEMWRARQVSDSLPLCLSVSLSLCRTFPSPVHCPIHN